MRQELTNRRAKADHSAFRITHSAFAERLGSPSRPAFTLVELLVVITIIGILAALLIVAASGAIRTANQATIRAEMTQLSTALEDYKNNVGSYPPNAQAATWLDGQRTLANFRRHFNKAFPSNREPAALIAALCGQGTGTQTDTVNPNLPGGMTAAEALVFWIGGFSSDAKYPISGPGGPSYSVEGVASGVRHQQDPIESRSWRLDINITQLGPRLEDGFFAGVEGSSTDNQRFVLYPDPRTGGLRRLNFWHLLGPNSPMPYVYFDASRGNPAVDNDAPGASTAQMNLVASAPDNEIMQALARVFGVKAEPTTAGGAFLWANDSKFQLLHCGIDEAWGEFPQMIVNTEAPPQFIPSPNITFPEGPWTLDLRDTLTNFSDGTLEDAQP